MEKGIYVLQKRGGRGGSPVMEEAHKGTFADMALYKIERAKDELDTAKIVLEAQKM